MPAQRNPLFGIHTVELKHFFRGIHFDTDQLRHDGFLHWTVNSSVSSQEHCEPSTPSVLSENQQSGHQNQKDSSSIQPINPTHQTSGLEHSVIRLMHIQSS
ncbi:hypothetical protein LU298_14300 [Komagataeibacter intermedius]|uniref:hypothetical protein n=1 Tax=Komagataeibacter intermedius TaxID=66229 RepID=UPI001F3DD0A5|nr:hypothetical protein [Komagataeibacter intermedius]MCF3637658.1 hypothetical protein [Komagataeibacter intermedius]